MGQSFFCCGWSNGQGWECSVAVRCGASASASASATRWSVCGCRREVADEEVPRLAVWRDVAWRGDSGQVWRFPFHPDPHPDPVHLLPPACHLGSPGPFPRPSETTFFISHQRHRDRGTEAQRHRGTEAQRHRNRANLKFFSSDDPSTCPFWQRASRSQPAPPSNLAIT